MLCSLAAGGRGLSPIVSLPMGPIGRQVQRLDMGQRQGMGSLGTLGLVRFPHQTARFLSLHFISGAL